MPHSERCFSLRDFEKLYKCVPFLLLGMKRVSSRKGEPVKKFPESSRKERAGLLTGEVQHLSADG